MTIKHPQTVGVIGLGYVGLPLACSFGRAIPTIGFDVNPARIEGLQKGVDKNGEVSAEELTAIHLSFTHDPATMTACDAFIIAVPTPTDKAKRPDLRYLISASKTVGEIIQKRKAVRGPDGPTPVIVYESTVYPGCTEDDCVPVIETTSGLTCGTDFKVGYSPERINPGDKEHTFETIIKVVSGQDADTLDIVATLYERVVKAGVHRAPTIKVAEAAKVIENTQRDINIALMNELSMLFERLGIPTQDVLAASQTKWNFLPFTPGLVGGHCIPEDPYYLTHKAEMVGFHPQIILAGRRINDGMADFVAARVVKELGRRGNSPQSAPVLVCGMTFKENVPDFRNSRSADLCESLEQYGITVHIHDPYLSGVTNGRWAHADLQSGGYSAVVFAVAHKEYLEMDSVSVKRLFANPEQGVLFDVRGRLASKRLELSPLTYCQL